LPPEAALASVSVRAPLSFAPGPETKQEAI